MENLHKCRVRYAKILFLSLVLICPLPQLSDFFHEFVHLPIDSTCTGLAEVQKTIAV